MFADHPTRLLEAPKGTRLKRYIGRHAAKLSVDGSTREVLAESMLPLVVERGGKTVPVDLALHGDAEGFAPISPLVETRFPDRAGEGLSLGSNVRMRLAGADPLVAGVRSEQQVIYANVLRDSDLLATPLPLGLETFVQLRSADSPRELTFELEAPRGATTRVQPLAGTGGSWVEVLLDGHVLARVAPATAVDAAGRPVPLRTEVDGLRITLTADMPDAVAWPVLVDPVIEQQFAGSDTNRPDGVFRDVYGWKRSWSNADKSWFSFQPDADNVQVGGNCPRPEGYLAPTLCVGVWAGLNYPAPSTARWSFRPPAGQPWPEEANGDAYIYRAEMRHAYIHGGGQTNFVAGLVGPKYNNGAGDWVGYSRGKVGPEVLTSGNGTWYGTYCIRYDCAENMDAGLSILDGTYVTFGLARSGVANASAATTQGAVIFQSDRTPATVGVTKYFDDARYYGAGEKVNVLLHGHDDGMGAKQVKLWVPYTAGLQQLTVDNPCEGNRLSPCRKDHFGNFEIDTARLPEGTTTITADATDILQKQGPAKTFNVKVDRTGPGKPTLSNDLWDHREQTTDHRSEGVYSSTSTLDFSASDAHSGVASVQVKLDGQVVHTSANTCATSGCPSSRTASWTLHADSYADGRHTLEVTAFDQLGRASTPATMAVVIDRRGDVYRVEAFEGAPELGVSRDETEWFSASSHAYRSENEDSISTRRAEPCDEGSCAVLRVRGGTASDGYTWTVYRGTSADDASLPDTSLRSGAEWRDSQTVATVPITAATSPGQTLPPLHGATADQHSVEGTTDGVTFTDTWWLDSETKLPLRTRSTASSGERLYDTYFNYALDRTEATQLPADFFAIAAPASTDTSQEVRYTDERSSAAARGAQTDQETSQSYLPLTLGHIVSLGGLTACLVDENNVTYRDDVPDERSLVDGHESSELPSAITYSNAHYALGLDPTCGTRAQSPDDLLTVRTMSSSSSYAAALREDLRRTAEAVDLDPDHLEFDLLGALEVSLSETLQTAWIIAAGADERIAFVDRGATSILIRGGFRKADLQSLLNGLEAR